MKRYCLPDTFVDEVLPTIPADAQAVLFALLWYSNHTLKPVWPSLKTIGWRAGIKSEKTVRAKIRLLEQKKVIVRQSVPFAYDSRNGRSFQIMQNVYTFNLQYYVEKDIKENLSKPEDFTDEKAVKNIVADTVENILKKLPNHLRPWLQHMEFTRQENKVLYFKPKEKRALPKTHVEEEFRKVGLRIMIAG